MLDSMLSGMYLLFHLMLSIMHVFRRRKQGLEKLYKWSKVTQLVDSRAGIAVHVQTTLKTHIHAHYAISPPAKRQPNWYHSMNKSLGPFGHETEVFKWMWGQQQDKAGSWGP